MIGQKLISEWCSTVVHEYQTLFNLFYFSLLFIYLSFRSFSYSINYFSFIFSYIIISIFLEEKSN